MNLTDAIAIIEELAEGIDPITGEVLPDCSPYRESSVIRALYTAAQQLKYQQDQSELPKIMPAKAGSSWTGEEDRQLVQEFEARFPIPAIADRHQRTREAIVARLVRLGKLASRYDFNNPEDRNDKGEVSRKWWQEQGRTQAGKPWAPEEDEALLRDFELGMSIERLAERLRRGIRAVEVRLVKLGRPSRNE